MVLQSQPQYNYDSQVIKIKNRLIGSVSFVMFKFNFFWIIGSGCSTVGREVAVDGRDAWNVGKMKGK